MKNLQTRCVYFVQEARRLVQLLLNIFYYVKDCMAAPEKISIFFKERAAASESINERLILKENAQVVFLCVCGCF